MYSRTNADFKRGNFRVQGDTIDVFLAYDDIAVRIGFWGDEIETIHTLDPINNKTIEEFEHFLIFPANIFVTSKDSVQRSIIEIQDDLVKQIDFSMKLGGHLRLRGLKVG